MKPGLLLALLCLSMFAGAAAVERARPVVAESVAVTIGSKDFTEAVILGEIARLAAGRQGVDAVHRRSLGGTRILWRALQEGEIDAYAEYTEIGRAHV